MANIATKIGKRIKNWFGYYNGPINVYAGRGFEQGIGLDVNVETFQIKRFGIKIIKEVKVNADPMWFENLKSRLAKDALKNNL